MYLKYRNLLVIIFLFLLVALGGRLYFHLTDGFRLAHITPEFLHRESFSISSPQLSTPEVKRILRQKFTWLGKGAQYYAFLSEDGNYVLKIVKQKHLQLPQWEKCLYSLPPLADYGKKREESKRRKIHKFLTSNQIAFEQLCEECALLYHHFHPSTELATVTEIQDKIGFTYAMNMDQQEFILQKKIDPFLPTLQKHIQQGNRQQAKEAIDQILHLIAARAQKGIIDTDRRLIENVGFLNGRAVFIDTGEFALSNSTCSQEQLHAEYKKRSQVLLAYLQTHSPPLAEYLKKKI